MEKWVLMTALFAVTMGYAKPNIVFIYADDLDGDEINCTRDMTDIWATHTGAKERGFWNKKIDSKVLTPNIDSLADGGMLFTRFYVNGTVCTSSRYCLMTGRYATRGIELQKDYPAGTHAQLDWRPAILREETNLPKTLQAAGYRTGIIGKWHNLPDDKTVGMPKMKKNEREPNAQYDDVATFEAKLKKAYKAGVNYLSDGFGWDVVDRMEWGNSIVNLDWQCEGALKFIEESKGQPFFLYCSLPVPHGQYIFDYNQIESYDRRVTSNGLLPEPMKLLPSNDDVLKRCKEAGVPKENAMATRMDDYVGAVLSKLDELGLRENTIVIYTSDHGSRGKNSVYEGGAKVPLLIEWPGKVKAGARCDSLIGNIDFAATLVELAGGALPEDMATDSRSFTQQLAGKGEPEDWRKAMLIEAGNARGIVSRDWKYLANRVTPEVEKKMKERPREVFWTGVDHHNYQNEQMYPSFWDADQLFDLNEDLYEQKNLAANPEYAAILKRKQMELEGFMSSLPHTFGEYGAKK
ncbi:Choline-sulfatase [Pontiella desulfatans]|uniref:Choline-sulfatase n=1 Tax=Pontiella desulfatans TaxID=2750659 RepID=A0A6C2TZ89_PONDE|nr:sulfatase-like hydrolase/transferase [Pontiella desulfatans]SPS73720.1 sulfatase S1_51 [Kiritimatiellales bacterium]VGO13038.1 Choline-sulfatase [Pontiella desulfatans]